MTLEIYTCQLGTRVAKAPGALKVMVGDITEIFDISFEGKSRVSDNAKKYGELFKPSQELMTLVRKSRAEQRAAFMHEATQEEKAELARAFETAMWIQYSAKYIELMRASFRRNRTAWKNLLDNVKLIVLGCDCTSPKRCHRTLLARDILPCCGANYGGEIWSKQKGPVIEKIPAIESIQTTLPV